MKTSLVVASSLLVVVIFVIKNSFKEVSLLPHKPKAIEKDSTKGFKPLFDGKSFDDWKLLLRNGTAEEIEKVFTIDHDGTLHFFRDLPEGSGNDETRRNAFHGIMATKKNYSRYHLKFEYKWGKRLVNNYDQFQYDAGVFYHIKELKIWPVGLQYQIRYNHITNKNHSGDFVASNVKMQWFSQDDKTFKLPSEGGTPQPIRKGQHFAAKDLNFNGLNDKWNTGEVIVMGDEYALHFLNGKLANMAKNLEPNEGPIAFEAETGEIYWRNIRIKEFKKSVPMQNFVH